jgi:hypothetical protein
VHPNRGIIFSAGFQVPCPPYSPTGRLVAKLAKASAMAADWSEAVTIARLEVEDRNKTIAALKARVAELEEYLTAFRDEKQAETPANAQPRMYTCVQCRANTWSALGTISLTCHTCGGKNFT